jgi:polysaccharide biosynthesis protein PslG
MVSHSSRRLSLPGLGLLVLSMAAVSACGTAIASSGAVQAHNAMYAPMEQAAPPVEASMAASKLATKAAAHKGKTAKSARATHPAVSGSPGSGSGSGSGSSQSSAPPPSASTSGVVYGISDPTILNESPSVQAQQLAAMKAMGITSVRLDASWYWGQPNGAGSAYVWAALDEAVGAIHQAGLSVDLIIDGTPAWAAVSGAAGDEFAQPADPAQFGAWAGAVAGRYADRGVAFFEIWNEENINWAPVPNPSAYTADLEAAYSAIKAADPSSMVLSGGLAPASDTSTTYDPRTFLQDMYADGAKGSFDGVAVHPYSFPATPDDYESWSAWTQMSQTSPSLRSIMAQNCDGAKKLYITEYGAPTSGSGAVSDSEQSTMLTEAITQATSLGYIGSLYIYTWNDITDSSSNDGYGLLNSDDSQKPAYSAVAAALANP